MEKIDYVGLNKFDVGEKAIVKEYVEKNIKKISREVDDYTLKINLKKHSTSNKKIDERVNYSIHAKIEKANIVMYSTSDDDWDLKLVLNRVFDKLGNEIKHKSKSDKKSWISWLKFKRRNV